MAFGTVVFTLRNLRIAGLLPNLSYVTQSYSLEHGSELSFEVMADTDQLRSYGMIAELLSVVTHLEFTLINASLDPDGMFPMTGIDWGSSGSAPNQVATADILAGDDGLPYFGIVGDFASLYGSSVLIGLRRCKLDTLPGWKVEMNKFRIAETKGKAIVIDTTTRRLHRVRRYETGQQIPTDLNLFFAA
jgi:hypothetical protein